MPSTVPLYEMPVALEPGLEHVTSQRALKLNLNWKSTAVRPPLPWERVYNFTMLDNEAIYWYVPVIATGCVLL